MRGFVLGLVLFGGLAATAAEPAPATTDTFEILLGDKVAGTEAATRATAETGSTLRSRVDLTLPGGISLSFSQEADLDAAAKRILRYRCDLDAGGTRARFRATSGETGWKLDAGPADAPAPAATKDLPKTSGDVVIDNNFASHLDLFCRGLALEPGGTASNTVIVPQALQAMTMKTSRLADADAATARYRLELANTVVELDCRKSDGALLEGRVPLQNATYRRKGYVPPKREEAVDDRERTVAVKGPAGELAGVLTVPRSERPVSAMLMLSGSGPNDRDETIGPNKPFRDLARGLADRGIASLRFDKRTVTIKDPSRSSTLRDEYVVDALEALRVLRAAPGIDAARVFVLGHSLGTIAAPLVAKEGEGVRGLVLMAGPARPTDVLILDQVARQMQIAGQDAATIAKQTEELRAAFERIKRPDADAPPLMGAPAAYWRDVLRYDLTSMVAGASIPVLVLQGEKDVQISKELDFEALRKKVGDAGGRVSYRSFPGLNHLFMQVDGESTGAEYGIPGHVDPAVVAAIADWVMAR